MLIFFFSYVSIVERGWVEGEEKEKGWVEGGEKKTAFYVREVIRGKVFSYM